MARFSKKKSLLNSKCVLIFFDFVLILSGTFLILRRNDKKCILVFTWSTLYSCWVLTNLEFSRQIFEKSSNIKFHQNPYIKSRVVPYERTDGRTDRQTDMTKLIVAFRNFAKAPKKRVDSKTLPKKFHKMCASQNIRVIIWRIAIWAVIVVCIRVIWYLVQNFTWKISGQVKEK
jgi:hypothetical protein